MKAKIVLTVLVAVLTSSLFSQVKVSGRLVDEKAVAVEFANIAFQSADKFTGTISEENGSFELQVSPGDYKMKISVIGYETIEKEIKVQKENIDLGEIQIKEVSVEIGEVVVKADRIVRKADRFVISLVNDPTIFGKTGTDILSQSPGIIIQERDGLISINGKAGTKVYINERPLHESGTDLINYLKNLKAEDIMRIEVVPLAGAEYDANIQGGIIKITMKRLRSDGMNGNAGVNYGFAPGEDVSNLNPSLNMNYRNNRLSLYTALNYDRYESIEYVNEEVINQSINRNANSNSDTYYTLGMMRARFGGVYDLSDRQSIGMEGSLSDNLRKSGSDGTLAEVINNDRTDITSRFNGRNDVNSYSASANYMLQLDSLGSMFKVLLDYHHNDADDNQNYNSEFRGFMSYDTIYRSNMTTINDLYAASADLSYRINDFSTLSTGVKYVHNEMETGTLFEYQNENNWFDNDLYSNAGTFTEDIAAVFASFSSNIKKVSYSVGLRGEYTKISPWTDKSDKTIEQDYFKIFPTVNVMVPFGKKSNHSLVMNYNRKISRPSFNNLSPFRYPASEYLYIEGNPSLEAVTPNDYTIALNLFNRFNIVAGVNDTKGAVERVITTNADAPNILIHRWENIGRNTNYYLSTSASLKPLAWWQMNINMTGSILDKKIFDVKRSTNMFTGYMANSFTLPKEIMVDLSCYYMSSMVQGNMKAKVDMPQLNLSIRKQFLNKRLNANLYANNILGKEMMYGTTIEKDFTDHLNVRGMFRQFGVSLSYSFSAGKSVKVKNVQTGAAEEKARMQ